MSNIRTPGIKKRCNTYLEKSEEKNMGHIQRIMNQNDVSNTEAGSQQSNVYKIPKENYFQLRALYLGKQPAQIGAV